MAGSAEAPEGPVLAQAVLPDWDLTMKELQEHLWSLEIYEDVKVLFVLPEPTVPDHALYAQLIRDRSLQLWWDDVQHAHVPFASRRGLVVPKHLRLVRVPLEIFTVHLAVVQGPAKPLEDVYAKWLRGAG